LQNWHLYFFSGMRDDDDDDLRIADDEAAVGMTSVAGPGIFHVDGVCGWMLLLLLLFFLSFSSQSDG